MTPSLPLLQFCLQDKRHNYVFTASRLNNSDFNSDDYKYCLIWYLEKFLCTIICLFKLDKDLQTANDTSDITSPHRKCVVFTSLMRLHMIDISSLKEKNTVRNITLPSRILNLKFWHLSLQPFMIFTSLLKGDTSYFKCLSLLRSSQWWLFLSPEY